MTQTLTLPSADELDRFLSEMNQRGETPTAVGFDLHGHPFLAYGWAPGGDGWDAGFVDDDPHSSEFDYSDGTGRCEECGAFDRRSVEKLAYPVTVLTIEASGQALQGGTTVLGVPVSPEATALLASVEEFRSAPSGTASSANLRVPFAGEGGSCRG